MTTLIGTNPDQIPVNSMLGGMAYQDPDSINVKDFKYSGTLSGLGNSSIVSTSGDVSSTVHANNATGGAIAILKAGDGTSSSYYSYLRIVNNDSSPKTWDIGTRGNDNLHIYDGTTTRVMVSSGIDHVQFNSGNTSFFIGNGATAGGGTTDDTSFNWSLGGAVKLCRNSTLVAEIDSSNNLIMKTSGALKVSEGTTAQRPASPQEGMIRKNSTLGVIEGYSGGDYVSLEAGRLISRTVFTSDGTFTPNSKTKEMIVELVGGGGGSGGVPTTGASQASLSTAGGFGEYLKAHWPRSVPVAASYNVLIGTGGAGGSAGTNSGLAGGQTRFSDGVGSIAGAKGGYGGAGGVVETVFPVIRKAALAPSDSYVSGSFQEWDKLSPPRPTTIIYNSSGSVMVADLIQPFVHRNDVGVGGDFKVSFASTAQAGGNPGQSGVVVIYEYS